MIENIIKREWDFFDKVNNIGGRANCQDNYPTFYIHRKAQFLNFDEQTLQSYLDDLIRYEAIHLNPITLKYAYMMESNDPIHYNEIKDQIPAIDDKTKLIVDELVAIHLEMLKECNQKYPKFASISRDVNASDDNENNTSYETYLRGELYTYSPNTLASYAKMIIHMVHNKINFVLNNRDSCAKEYGYLSIDDAESKI